MGSSGLSFEGRGVQWVIKEADIVIEDAALISGVPLSWARAWSEVRKEALKAEPDPKVMCAILAETLDWIKPLITFSRLHQALYVLAVFVSHRRILWRSTLEKVPIQIRFVETMILLMRSASEIKPNTRLIGEAAKLIEDCTDVSHIKESYLKWEKLRDIVCGNLEAVMMLGLEDAL